MSLYLKKACIMYGVNTWIFGGVGYEQADMDSEEVERYDHIASDGGKVSYYVGERRMIDRTFRWQDDTLEESWRTFFRNSGGRGEPFWYYDDSPPICGSAGNAGGGAVCGGISTGVLVTLEPTQFRPGREDVDGYWAVQLTMRRVV